MQLVRQKFELNTGDMATFEYDPNSDLLEVIFRVAEASAAIELTESIILRFDWATSEPLSLSFMSFSKLLQPTAYGELHFQLLSEEWPFEAKEKILDVLQKPPLNEFLTLTSFSPAHSHQIIPSATIKRPVLTSLAV